MSLIHTSSLPDVDIPEMSITDYVFHKASAYPDRIAISDGAGNQYTFAELEQALAASPVDSPPAAWARAPASP